MKLKTKINQRMQDSSHWILNSPESLVILMFMGSGIATLFFGVFSFAMGYNKYWFLMVLFGVFSLLSVKGFVKIFKMYKNAGFKNALGGITANEFVWHKGGNKDGNKGSIEADEVCNEQDDSGNGKIGKEVRDIYFKPE